MLLRHRCLLFRRCCWCWRGIRTEFIAQPLTFCMLNTPGHTYGFHSDRSTLHSREFALSVGWYILGWVTNRLRAGIPSRYVTSHPGQLSLLPSVGRDFSTVQSAVMHVYQRTGHKAQEGILHSCECRLLLASCRRPCYGSTRHSRRRRYSVQSRLSVCLSVCPRSNGKTAWAINTKLCTRILYSSRSAWIDTEVKRSKAKVTRLRKPSLSHGCYSDQASITHPYRPLCCLRPLTARVCMSIQDSRWNISLSSLQRFSEISCGKKQTDRCTDRQTNTTENRTPVTTVGVATYNSKYITVVWTNLAQDALFSSSCSKAESWSTCSLNKHEVVPNYARRPNAFTSQ